MTGKVGKGTARQTVRIDHQMWDDFGALADSLGTDRSVLIREFIAWMLDQPNAKMPSRSSRRDGVDA